MIWWPTPYKAPNFTDGKTLIPPKPITAQSYKKPKERLQQSDWSNVTNEPVAPFALNPIVQGSKPILPIKTQSQTTVTTPQITQQPVEPVQAPKQLPQTGVEWYKPMLLDKQEYIRVANDYEKNAFADMIQRWADPEVASIAFKMLVDKRVQSEINWNKIDINPFKPISEWLNKAKEFVAWQDNMLVNNPITRWWLWVLWTIAWWLTSFSEWTQNIASKWVSEATWITNPQEEKTTVWEDIFWTVSWLWSIATAAAPVASTAFNVWMESLPKSRQESIWSTLWDVWSFIAKTPWLKQWRESLPEEKRAQFDQELAWTAIALLTWVKDKGQAIKNPKQFLKTNLNPLNVARNIDEAVLNWLWTTVAWVKNIPKIPWKLLPKVEKWVPTFTDRAISATLWLDADTVRRFKDSPEIVKALDEWKITKESIKQDLIDAVDTVSTERKWVGSAYQDIYTRPDTFNAKEITNDINKSLSDQWVKIKNWKIVWFDTTKMTWLTDQAKTALKSKYEDVISTLKDKWEINIEQLHNIRKDLYNTAYQDWFVSKKAPWVSKVSDVLNERLKKIPWFSEADAWFKEASDLLNEIKSNVLTKDWNFKWTLKSLLWEKWQARLDVLEKHFPWLKDKIETLSAYDDYLNTRNQKKVWLYEKAWTAWASAVGWFLMWWPIGAIVSWIAWPILSDFVRDPVWFKNYIIKKAWKDIASKIELWTKLTNAETTKAKVALEQIKNNPNLALEYKPQTATPVTPTGKVQEKVVIPPKKLPKSQTIVAEKWTAVSPAEQAKFAEAQAKQQEIIAKKQQAEQAQSKAQEFEKKASDYQKVLEDSKDYKKLWVFDILWGWWIKNWDYVTKYWTITNTQRWMSNLLEYKIWDKWYKARDVDVFEKWATPEIIPVKEADDVIKARQDIKDMQADKQRRNLYVNQLLEEMNLKSVDDLPADKLPEFAKILRTRNRSWDWMTRYENFVKENKAEAPKPKAEKVPVKTETPVNKWSAIADNKVKIPVKK